MRQNEAIPQAYFENERWACDHSAEIDERYEGRWVAIADRQVVASGSSARVREAAAHKTGRPTSEVFVRFVDSPFAIYGQSSPLLRR